MLLVSSRKEQYFLMKKQNLEREIQLNFRVNESEKNKIFERMKLAKLKNFAVYARLMLVSGKIQVIDFESITKLRYEVNRIGVNINQITKLGNENQDIKKSDIQELLLLQKQLNEQVNLLIKQTIKDKNNYGSDESFSNQTLE